MAESNRLRVAIEEIEGSMMAYAEEEYSIKNMARFAFGREPTTVSLDSYTAAAVGDVINKHGLTDSEILRTGLNMYAMGFYKGISKKGADLLVASACKPAVTRLADYAIGKIDDLVGAEGTHGSN